MKILFIASQVDLLNSSAAIRNSALIKGLKDLGHDVFVETLEYPESSTSNYLKRIISAKVHRTELPILLYNKRVANKYSKNKGLIYSFLRYVRSLFFFPDIFKSWIQLFNYNDLSTDYDLLISSSDSKVSHIVANKVNKKLSIKWIQIWGDPWYDDFTMPFLNKGRAYIQEWKLLRNANRIIYVSNATKNKQSKLFARYADKMYFVPRGFLTNCETGNKVGNKIIISYTGNLFWGRNIQHLIDAIDKYNRTLKDLFILNIYGILDNRFIEKASCYKFINSFPPKDYENILEVYNRTNILLFISNSSNSTQIPGKFYDYSGTNRPILCLMDDDSGEVADYLKKFDRCIVIKNSFEEIFHAFEKLINVASKEFSPPEEFYPQSVAASILEICNRL